MVIDNPHPGQADQPEKAPRRGKRSQRPARPGREDPMFRGELAWLSSFHEGHPFAVGGLGVVETVEHAYNALRTTDEREQSYVLLAPTPAEAKRRGRRVTLRPDWEIGGRVAAMTQIIEDRFTRPDLAELLLATGDLELIETNYWHDQFWGSCLCTRHHDIPGANRTGELLMATRTRLAAQAARAQLPTWEDVSAAEPDGDGPDDFDDLTRG